MWLKLVLSNILQNWVLVEETLDYVLSINLKRRRGVEESGRGREEGREGGMEESGRGKEGRREGGREERREGEGEREGGGGTEGRREGGREGGMEECRSERFKGHIHVQLAASLSTSIM